MSSPFMSKGGELAGKLLVYRSADVTFERVYAPPPDAPQYAPVQMLRVASGMGSALT